MWNFFINQLSTWVCTDVSHYTKREDIEKHMESLYPTTYDARRKRFVKQYDVKVHYDCRSYSLLVLITAESK
jgi:hypothetical protein